MFVQTIIRYCKFTNSNKQFCGRSNRASIAKLLTRYHNNDYNNHYYDNHNDYYDNNYNYNDYNNHNDNDTLYQ